MRKIIVRLGNGLGNQLFTYAAAYSFAKKNNIELFIDDESGFYKRYKYELHNFNISAKIINKSYKFIGFYGRLKRKILIKLSKFNKNTKFLIESRDVNKLTEYNADQLNINFVKNLYFEGYFQSERYYKINIEDIFREFSFKKNILNQNILLAENIKKTNSVSIHFRQNKFLSNENHKNLNQLNSEFTKNNISLIKRGIDYFDKHIDNPKYYVFASDLSKIKTFFDSKKFILVNENYKKDPAYDLYLMSLCKHFILSPSSMHYWGAQLSKNKDKICLSPNNIKDKSGFYGFSNNKDIKANWWKDF